MITLSPLRAGELAAGCLTVAGGGLRLILVTTNDQGPKFHHVSCSRCVWGMVASGRE